ncbi:protein phosphatase CheZ [Deltaproteobacteria bacterium TL4]
MSGGTLSTEAMRQLPPLLKTIDEQLVVLEQDRHNVGLVTQLATHLDQFTEMAQTSLRQTPVLTRTMSSFLQGVHEGKLTLSSPAFEKLFNAVVLIQEQLEWSSQHESEVQGSLWAPLVAQMQMLASAQELPVFETSATLPRQAAMPSSAPATSEVSVPPALLDKFAADSERLLGEMKELEEITYSGDLEAIRDHLHGCITLCENVYSTAKTKEISQHTESMASILEELKVMIGQWAIVHGKEVELVINEGCVVSDYSLFPILRKALFQCTEFLIDVSLESAINRRKKSSVGRIYVDITNESENFLITIADDGKGLRSDVIKNRALEQAIVPENTLNAMSEQEVWNLLFHESMHSVEDGEVGAHFPELKADIESVGGDIGIESTPGEMTSFILVFPEQVESNFVNTVSKITTHDVPIQLRGDLDSIHYSAEVIQSIMGGDAITPRETAELKHHLNNVFAAVKILIEGQDPNRPDNSLTLSEIANVDLFKEVGTMAREMHESLKDFSNLLDSQFQQMALEEIPDATHRLEHIIEMTEKSANTTLDLAEELVIESDSTVADMESFKELLEAAKASPGGTELEESLQIIEMVKAREKQVSAKIYDIMTAQDYQDRTGQVIKKIIVLVDDLENRLVSLVKTFGTTLGLGDEEKEQIGKPVSGNGDLVERATHLDESNVQMYGPQHKSGKGVAGQDEVDDLLAQFGF